MTTLLSPMPLWARRCGCPCSLRAGACMWGVAFALTLLCAVVASGTGRAAPPDDVPELIRDEDAGDWVVDRFAGNSTAGVRFFQGPAVQTGGVGRTSSFAVAPDGRAFFPVSEGIAQVSADGVLRLVVSREEWEADGLDHNAFARGGLVAWNTREECLYFWGHGCLRRLVTGPEGRRIERVAGDPVNRGLVDGPVEKAQLAEIGNITINSRGTVFFYDGDKQYGSHLRKLENGVVTTITDKLRAGKLVDGPLAEAQFNFINLGGLNSVGETDDVLYIADHWNSVVRRIDLAKNEVTTVAGMQRPADKAAMSPRFGKHADGPALTHFSSNSGLTFATYDPVHRAIWLGGPDEIRLRWLRLHDGVVKTVIGSDPKPPRWDVNASGVPADAVNSASGLIWCWVLAVDRQGRAYFNNGQSKTGYWRASNRKENPR